MKSTLPLPLPLSLSLSLSPAPMATAPLAVPAHTKKDATLKALGKKALHKATAASSSTSSTVKPQQQQQQPARRGASSTQRRDDMTVREAAEAPPTATLTPTLAALKAASAGTPLDAQKHPGKQQSFKIAREKERKEKLWKNLGDERPAVAPEGIKSRNHRVFLAPARHVASLQQRPSWGQTQAAGGKAGARSVTEQLHTEILEYAEYTRSTVRTMAVHIEEMITNVRGCVCSLWAKAKVEPFGSYSTGIWLPSSDVDLVILGVVEINNRMLIVKFLKQLAKALESQPWVESIHVLESAKIPVLKLVTAETSVPIDITFESSATHSGLLARELIKEYADEMPELYPLAIVFKQLLRERDLNDAYTGGLSSYSIVLMLIHFQQLWRRGTCCFKAAERFASGGPLPRPAELLKEIPPALRIDPGIPVKSSKAHSTKESANSPTASPKAAASPPSTSTSSYASIVAKPKGVKRSAPETTPVQKTQPFSYAAVAAGIAKIQHAVPTAPSSYAAAVSTTKAPPPTAVTKVVRMPIVTKAGVKSGEPTKDSVSVTSSLADTEDLSSCGDSPAASTTDEVEDDAHDGISTSADQISLGELTMNILEFFGITFDYRKNGISVRDGGYIYRLAESSTLGKKLPPLVIEDPIHSDRNVSASSFAFSKVVATMEDSYYALKYFHPTRFTPTALSCLLSVSGHTRHTPSSVVRSKQATAA